MFELSRVAELSGLPGETLTKLAREMERHELGSGEELDPGGDVALVLGGMLTGAGACCARETGCPGLRGR